MNGMDAVIQIRNGAVKGFSIYADKTRGCAARLPLCASLDAFHSTLNDLQKAKLCLSIKAFYAVRIFERLHGGVRIAQRVGWVEQSDTHQVPRRQDDGFRKSSTHPTR